MNQGLSATTSSHGTRDISMSSVIVEAHEALAEQMQHSGLSSGSESASQSDSSNDLKHKSLPGDIIRV